MPHDGARRDSLLFGDNLVDLSGARELAARDKHQFQWWAVSLVDAVPQGGKKKGADRGIDGIRWVRTGPRRGDLGQMIVSVKAGGNVSVRDVRGLAGTVEREKAAGGILVTLAKPTRDMLREAASHGFFDYGLGKSRKIVVKTIDELLRGVQDETERLPPIGRHEGFRTAPRESVAVAINPTCTFGRPALKASPHQSLIDFRAWFCYPFRCQGDGFVRNRSCRLR